MKLYKVVLFSRRIIMSGLLYFVICGFAIFFVGLPLTIICSNDHKEYLWAKSAFVGISLIIVFFRLFIELNIPMKSMLILFIIFIIFLWGIVIWQPFGKHSSKQTLLHDLVPNWQFSSGVIGVAIISGIPMIKVGVSSYKGYGWWDQFFYATQAEYLARTPLSHLDNIARSNPYVGAIWQYFHGYERIGRGVLQGFFAIITGSTGEATLAFTGFLGIFLIFCSMILLTHQLKLGRKISLFISLSVMLAPNIVTTQLEGFLPVLYFTSLLIFIISELPAALKKGMYETILLSLIIVATLSIFPDGFYILVPLILIAFIGVHFESQYHYRLCLNTLILLISIFIINLGFWSHFTQQIMIKLGRTSLNGIYYFANSVRVLNWAFWGTTMASQPNLIYLLFTFSSIIVFIAGFIGIIFLYFKKKNTTAFLCVTLLITPVVFLIQKQEMQYSFYKLFSFAFPLVILGDFYFISYLNNFIINSWSINKLEFLKVGITRTLTFLISVFFLAGAVISGYKSYQTIAPFSAIAEKNQRMAFIRQISSSEQVKFNQKLKKQKNQRILLVNQSNQLAYWWETYYAKKNHIYELSPTNQNIYFKRSPKPYDGVNNYPYFARCDYKKIPKDVKIMLSNPLDNLIKKGSKNSVAILDYNLNADDPRDMKPGIRDVIYEMRFGQLTLFSKTSENYIISSSSNEDLYFQVDSGTWRRLKSKQRVTFSAGAHRINFKQSNGRLFKASFSLNQAE